MNTHTYIRTYTCPLLITTHSSPHITTHYSLFTTQIATAMASLTWMIAEWAVRGKPSVLGKQSYDTPSHPRMPYDIPSYAL